MKILITGAAGFLGAEVVKRLLVHGFTGLRCFVRDPSKAERLEEVARLHPGAKVEICAGNLCSRADCAGALEDVQLVFHLAAGLRGSAEDLFRNSVVASRTLLEALEERKSVSISQTRIVLVSSLAVYGVAELKRGALVNEDAPLETHPEKRDAYSNSKLRQEQLFWEYQRKDGYELVVLRPGVIYGPGGTHLSDRVGLQVGPLYLHLGGRNLLPLSYVENCAEAVVVAGTHPGAAGQAINVFDDELPSAAQYLSQYTSCVKKLLTIRLPYGVTQMLGCAFASCHRLSMGKLPALLSPYKVATLWGGNRFSNARLHSLGWRQIVATPEGLTKTFLSFRNPAVQSVAFREDLSVRA